MAFSASSELPIIDFSKEAMKPGTETWDLTREHVQKAVEEYGCFIATFNEINHELYTELFNSLEKLFDLPQDTKRLFAPDGPTHGYASDLPQNPLYEAMPIADALNFQAIQKLTLLMWPQGDDHFCKTIFSYFTLVSKLEITARKMIFQNYGVDKYFEEESKTMKYNIRLLKYGVPLSDNTTGGPGSHYDTSFITILQANRVGLQVQTRGGEWISATPSASSLIVMMGEAFFGWSNGRLRCPLHRVVMSGSESRYSAGLFSTKEGTIKTPNELVDEQHTLLFKPFDIDGLVQIFLQQLVDKTRIGEDNYDHAPIVAKHFTI